MITFSLSPFFSCDIHCRLIRSWKDNILYNKTHHVHWLYALPTVNKKKNLITLWSKITMLRRMGNFDLKKQFHTYCCYIEVASFLSAAILQMWAFWTWCKDILAQDQKIILLDQIG